MNLKVLKIVFASLLATFASCTTPITDYMGNWVRMGDYNGKPRAEATCFTINNYGYYGLGRNDDEYLSDFWRYDPNTNIWSKMADFPGVPRAYGASVSNGIYGYTGLGYDGDNDLSDFWRYDPEKNEWTQIEDFPGGTRRNPVAFVIGNDIYVGTGTQEDEDVYFNDFWKYDGEQWTQIASITEKRQKAMAATINNKAYILGGQHNGVLNDFLRYDPETNSWEDLYDLNEEDHGSSAIPRMNGATFVVNNKLYLITGNTGNSTTSTCFEWDPDFPEWIEKTDHTGGNREGAGSFVLYDIGYIVGGRIGSNSSSFKDNMYMFQPNVENDDDDD